MKISAPIVYKSKLGWRAGGLVADIPEVEATLVMRVPAGRSQHVDYFLYDGRLWTDWAQVGDRAHHWPGLKPHPENEPVGERHVHKPLRQGDLLPHNDMYATARRAMPVDYDRENNVPEALDSPMGRAVQLKVNRAIVGHGRLLRQTTGPAFGPEVFSWNPKVEGLGWSPYEHSMRAPYYLVRAFGFSEAADAAAIMRAELGEDPVINPRDIQVFDADVPRHSSMPAAAEALAWIVLSRSKNMDHAEASRHLVSTIVDLRDAFGEAYPGLRLQLRKGAHGIWPHESEQISFPHAHVLLDRALAVADADTTNRLDVRGFQRHLRRRMDRGHSPRQEASLSTADADFDAFAELSL